MRRFKRSAGADPTDPIGLLLIGCGYWGRNYVRIFDELPGANVVAVCDGSIERLEAIAIAYPDVTLTASLDEALAIPGIDAAIVCTPAATHHDIALRCLQTGLHVLLEKPMTTTAEDADELGELADELGLTLMVGHTFLFNPGVRKVKEYIDSGSVGDIYYLYAQRTSLGPIRTDVNALWDLAPHDVSIFNFLLDSEPEWVSAVGSCALRSKRADVGFISLGYGPGLIAHIHVSWTDPNKVREVVLVGSQRRIVFNDTNPLERVRVFDKGVAVESANGTTYGEHTLLLRDGDIISPMVESSEPLKNQCGHYLECIRTGARPLSDSRVGRSVVSVMAAIDRSLESGGAPQPVQQTSTLAIGGLG